MKNSIVIVLIENFFIYYSIDKPREHHTKWNEQAIEYKYSHMELNKVKLIEIESGVVIGKDLGLKEMKRYWPLGTEMGTKTC